MYTTRLTPSFAPGGTPPTLGLWFCFRLLPMLTAWLLGWLLLSASVARAADDHFSGTGQLLLHSPGLAPAPAMIQHSTVHVAISGMVALVTLEQKFRNRIVNLGPGEAVVVKLEFVQPVIYAEGLFGLCLPMTLTPLHTSGRPLQGQTEVAHAAALPSYLGHFHATDVEPDAPLLATLLHPRRGADASPLNPLTMAVELGASRLFTLGLGSAPISGFLRKAAQPVRGRHLCFGDQAEISTRVAALLDYLSAPMLTDIRLQWPQVVVDADGPVPGLYAGAPLLRLVRFNMPPPPGVISVSGVLAGTPRKQEVSLNPGDDGAMSADAAGVASLCARERIAQILDQRYQSLDEARGRAEVLALALAHRLLAPRAREVAVEQQRSRLEGVSMRSVVVPTTRPRGQDSQIFAYPQTATTAGAKLFLVCFLLFIALLFWVMRGPEEDHVPHRRR